MKIENPTKYTLRKIHSFDLIHPELDERVLIDVLEPVGIEAPRFVAIPHLLGYKAAASIRGFGDSVEAALNDCLKKVSELSWESLLEQVNPTLK